MHTPKIFVIRKAGIKQTRNMRKISRSRLPNAVRVIKHRKKVLNHAPLTICDKGSCLRDASIAKPDQRTKTLGEPHAVVIFQLVNAIY